MPAAGVCLIPLNDRPELVEVASQTDGTFLVNGAKTGGRRWCSVSSFTIPYGDPLFEPPPLEGYVLSAEADTLGKWEELLSRVGPLLKLCPTTSLLVSSFGSFLLPLMPSPTGAHLSVSFKHRPGIIYASWSQNALEVFEAIVHEADHQCLFEVINEDGLLRDVPSNYRAAFRSPWRDDPRPLSGLFFGFSAFVTVGVSMANLVRAGVAGSDYGGRRAVLALEQAVDAISVVTDHGLLSARGEEVLEYNRAQALETLRKLETHSGSELWKAASRERREKDEARWRNAHGSEINVS